MAKPPRSPLLGYNHNLAHLGQVFHIQTEDSGPLTPRLFTHLFHEGTILVSRKHEYDGGLPDDKVRGLMQLQHKTLMKDLVRGRLDDVIIPFFALRGVELGRVQGAVPTAALPETPGPVMVLPSSAADEDERVGPRLAASEAIPNAPAGYIEHLAPPPAVAPPTSDGVPARPRRTTTRPLETVQRASTTPAAVVVRAPADGRRSPFVRSGGPVTTRMASADGVVVQRNVVVGGAAAPVSGRAARIRPPVPYVVTGGGHTERLPRPTAASSPSVSSTASSVATEAPAVSSGGAAAGETATVRATGGFGVALPEDKSLDEVILEYLSEDGEAG